NVAMTTGALRPAKRNKRVDLGDPSVLAWAKRNPFERDENGDPVDAPSGTLRAALLPGGDIDLDHPAALLFVARCGRDDVVDLVIARRKAEAQLEALDASDASPAKVRAARQRIAHVEARLDELITNPSPAPSRRTRTRK